MNDALVTISRPAIPPEVQEFAAAAGMGRVCPSRYAVYFVLDWR